MSDSSLIIQKNTIEDSKAKKWTVWVEKNYFIDFCLFTVFEYLLSVWTANIIFFHIYLHSRIPAPHIIAAHAYQMSPANLLSPTYDGRNIINATGTNSSSNSSSSSNNKRHSGSATFFCLSRLMAANQTNKTIPLNYLSKDDIPRRLSWERWV